MDQLNEFMNQLNNWNAANGGAIAITGWIFTLAALILAIVFYRASRQPRRFGWQHRKHTAVLNDDLKAWPCEVPVSVLSGTTSMKNPCAILLRLGNTGEQSIKFNVEDPPVRVYFKKAKLVDARIVDQSTPDIVAKLNRPTPHEVTFHPSLLARREWLDLLLITDGIYESPKVFAKVVDETSPPGNVVRLQFKAWGFTLVTSAAAFVWLGNFLPAVPKSSPLENLVGFGSLGALGLAIFSTRTIATKYAWAKKSKD